MEKALTKTVYETEAFQEMKSRLELVMDFCHSNNDEFVDGLNRLKESVLDPKTKKQMIKRISHKIKLNNELQSMINVKKTKNYLKMQRIKLKNQ